MGGRGLRAPRLDIFISNSSAEILTFLPFPKKSLEQDWYA
jgi:hypothetical protein